MPKLVTPADITAEAWKALHAMGLPERCISATIHLKGNDPIKIDCTFYAVDPAEQVPPLVEMTKTFVMVEAAEQPVAQAA